jgi:transcriptional regulator with XRE-family HTH domain
MAKQPKGIVEQLRQAIRAAEKRGTTRYRLAQVSGVTEGGLSRLVAGENIPRIDTADRILRALGKRLLIADT